MIDYAEILDRDEAPQMLASMTPGGAALGFLNNLLQSPAPLPTAAQTLNLSDLKKDQESANYLPWLVGGGVLLLGIILLAVYLSKK